MKMENCLIKMILILRTDYRIFFDIDIRSKPAEKDGTYLLNQFKIIYNSKEGFEISLQIINAYFNKLFTN